MKNKSIRLCALVLSLILAAAPFAAVTASADTDAVTLSVSVGSSDTPQRREKRVPELSKDNDTDEASVLTGKRTEKLGYEELVTATLDYDNGTLTFTGECGSDYYYYFDISSEEKEYVRSVIFTEGVKSLGDLSFDGCMNLTTVVLPDEITSIPSRLFLNCSSLRTIKIPDSTEIIGEYAFGFCTALERAELPKGLKTISDDAFHSCSSLKSITIPETVTKIAEYAFCQSGIESVTIPGGVETVEYRSFAECTSLKTVVFEEGVKKITSGAFENAPLESVSFPDSLFEIPDFSYTPYFKKMSENASDGFVISPEGILLKYTGDAAEITVPSNVNRLASNVFSRNDSIKSVDLGDKITYIPEGTFDCCHSIENVKMSDKVTYIGKDAFNNILTLKEIKLPASLKIIDDYAFYTSGLERVDIPDSVEKIGFMAFSETPFINSMEGDFICLGSILYQYKGTDKKPVVPDNIKHIGMSSFAGVPITAVTLPEGLLTIDEYAFCGCSDMQIIIIPDSVEKIENQSIGYKSGRYGVSRYGKMVMIGAEGSEAERYAEENDITFSSTTKPSGKCGEDAFWEVDLPANSLTIYGTGEMYDYDMYGPDLPGYSDYKAFIKTIDVKEGITSLGANAFYYYDNSDSLTLPDSLRVIGKNALHYLCVKEISVPENVEQIDTHYCFGSGSDYNTQLETIDVAEKNKRYFSGQGVLYDRDTAQLVCVPRACEAKTINVPEGITSISNYAFESLVNVEWFNFPEGFDFSNCTIGKDSESCYNVVFNGSCETASAESFDRFITDGSEVYCHFSKEGWQGVIDYFAAGSSEKQVTFHDLDTISDEIKLSSEKTQIAPFEAVRIDLSVEKLYEQEYDWSSSNPEVAVVSDSGSLIGLKEGSAVIMAKSKDGTQSDEITITVNGSFELKTGISRELNGEFFSDLNDENEELVFYPKYCGYFILKESTLYFYSINKDSFTPIHTFSDVCYSNVTGSKLTVCELDKLKNYRVVCFDLDRLSAETSVSLDKTYYTVYAVAADKEGKVYVSVSDNAMSSDNQYCIKVFSQSGELLNTAKTELAVVEIIDFPQDGDKMLYVDVNKDSTSMFSSAYLQNLQLGSIEDDKLVPMKYECGWGSGWVFLINGIEVMSDNSIGRIKHGAALYGDKYAVINCTARGANIILDLTDRPEDFSERNDIVYDESILAEEGILSEEQSKSGEAGDYCKGTRSVYREKSGSVIMYKSGKQLVEYKLSDGSAASVFSPEHYVYSLDAFSDDLIAIEKENGVYYLETIAWDVSTSAEISPERAEMVEGETQKISVQFDSQIASADLKWSTSDPTIATVSQNGTVYAWHSGTVAVTLTMGDFSSSCDITVLPRGINTGKIVSFKSDDSRDNASDHDYRVWSHTVNSYLFESGSGYTIIQNIPDKYDYDSVWNEETESYDWVTNVTEGCVLREEYDSSFERTSSTEIERELPLFGGAFSGDKYNFIVFGQENTDDDDSREVLRVVKYSKDWERIDALSLCGKNTHVPFDAGSLRMTEYGGVLYIATCHTMYSGGDGYNHQANMTFWIDEESLSVKNEFYDVSNFGECYVSHSFNQFIAVENGLVYRADHGDAYPRGAVLSTSTVDRIRNIGSTTIRAASEGDGNYTGITLSDFDINGSRIAAVGRSVDTSNKDSSKLNIYAVFMDKGSLDSKTEVMLTDLPEDSNVNVGDPYLTYIGNGHYSVLWEETTSDDDYNYSRSVKCVTIDEYGNISNVNTLDNARLSDCEPFIDRSGRIVWYTVENGELTFYALDPMNHPMKFKEGTEATCTKNGTTGSYVCSYCGETLIGTSDIPAKGHTEEPFEGKKPTCTEDGHAEGTRCSVCGETVSGGEIIPAAGHKKAVQKGYDATCTQDGLTDLIYCSVCGEIIEQQETIPALGHDYIDGICTRCSQPEPVQYDPELSGIYGDVDGDGQITANDALMILRYTVSMEQLSEQSLIASDVDGDGSTTANDALAVLRYTVGITEENKVAKPIV